MGDHVRVYVDGVEERLYRGMQVRHALIARDQAVYEAALRGEIRVEDGDGFPLALSGALTEGMRIRTLRNG